MGLAPVLHDSPHFIREEFGVSHLDNGNICRFRGTGSERENMSTIKQTNSLFYCKL